MHDDADAFELLFELHPQPMWVFDRETLAFLAVNRAACEHYGWSREEFLAMTIRDIRRAEDQAGFDRTRMEVPANGFRAKARHQTRSGQVIEVDLAFARVPFRDHPATLVVATDVTGAEDLRLAAERLRRSEANFRTLIEKAPTAILVHRDGRYVYANPAAVAMLGYECADEVIELGFYDVVHPDDRDTVRKRVEQISSQDSTPPAEVRMLRRDGSIVVIDAQGVRLEFDGKISTVVLAHDITQRRDLFARMALADRLLSVGTLAAGVAHEINNPLAYVMTNLELLDGELPRMFDGEPRLDRAELSALLADAREGTARVSSIVRDLRSLSRLDDNTGPIDVITALASSIKMVHNELRHRARVIHEYGDHLPAVHANASRLGQVFLNLLVNAAHSIEDGRIESNEIRIRAHVNGGHIEVAITDTGAGIPTSVLPRIFDPFYTTKPPGVGMGLGLSICHQIVQSIGGTISVASQLGVGSTFTVSLPIAADVVVEQVEPVAAVQVGASRVLIIDDEAAIGRSMRLILGPDHDVIAVTRAKDALERLAAGERFDAILCDLMMPEMSGIELYHQLAEVAPAYQSRVVFMTGGAFTPQAREFLSAIVMPHLEKPFTEDQLRQVLARLLSC